MIDLKNLSTCEKGHKYPKNFDKCPSCHDDAKRIVAPMTAEQADKAIAVSLRRGDIDASQIK